jgi:hypothetical protein
MKQIITLISATVLAGHASAAIITTNVTGVLGDWFTKSQIPATTNIIIEHFLTANPDIIVQGSISYDDATLDIDTGSYSMTALSLTQVGSLIASTVDSDVITISGLSWNLAGGTIDQLSGSASCLNNFSRCATMATAISGSDGNSPFEFDGIPSGFKIGAANQIPQDGYFLDTTFLPGAFYMDVVSAQPNLAGNNDNASNNALFELTPTVVPVPAAAWLMGSALVGLTSISRRRRS